MGTGSFGSYGKSAEQSSISGETSFLSISFSHHRLMSFFPHGKGEEYAPVQARIADYVPSPSGAPQCDFTKPSSGASCSRMFSEIYFQDIDMIAGIDDLEYPELLEDIPLEKAHEDAKQRPDDAERARVFMRRSLNGSYNRAMRNDRHISLPIELRDPSGTAPDYPHSVIKSCTSIASRLRGVSVSPYSPESGNFRALELNSI